MKKFLGRPDIAVYPNAGKRGIKIFTDGEIKRVSGYERLYRIFWNKKAEEVCTNKVLVKWTKTAIEGIIITEWTMKKTPLMNNHAMQLLNKEYPKHGKRRQKHNTVGNNLMEMLQAHKRLLYLDGKLRNLRESSNTEKKKKKKITDIEVHMKAKLTELKKIQESLRKSMENMAREKSVSNNEISDELEVDMDKLDRQEIEVLLHQIEGENEKIIPDQTNHSDESDSSVEDVREPIQSDSQHSSPANSFEDIHSDNSQSESQSILKRELESSPGTSGYYAQSHIKWQRRVSGNNSHDFHSNVSSERFLEESMDPDQTSYFDNSLTDLTKPIQSDSQHSSTSNCDGFHSNVNDSQSDSESTLKRERSPFKRQRKVPENSSQSNVSSESVFGLNENYSVETDNLLEEILGELAQYTPIRR